MTEWAIWTDDLTKQYGALTAVDRLNLRVPRGAVYGFVGRNGAGKSTTIKLLAGLVRATAGSARLLGHEVRAARPAMRERVAFVNEHKALYDSFTPAELVRFTRGFYPRWSDLAADKYARLLDVPMSRPFSKLSLGNRNKVCLLLALAQNAELLVLDEPSSGLDPVMMDDLLRILMDDHVAEGRTIFFSSHHLSDVERVADWVGIIDRGTLLLEAPMDEIRNEFRAITVAGTDLPLSRAAEVVSAVRADRFVRYVVRSGAERFAAERQREGATLVDVSPLSLREVFLELVRKEEPCTSGNAGATPASASSSI